MTNEYKKLYTGVTNNIVRRMAEHKSGLAKGWAVKYKLDKLVYVEETGDIREAITREKQIKGWLREKKNALVSSANPEWRDLTGDLW
ncbi:MAG: GIY-YIG nuclease family protein [Nitrospirae bacterium]|nr:GIY-YIG nuclease family protein [Nitrospirota bacterium]MBI5696662.1 GIY-YIG nuclease family protein [Nitrospirota bacterium]